MLIKLNIFHINSRSKISVCRIEISRWRSIYIHASAAVIAARSLRD